MKSCREILFAGLLVGATAIVFPVLEFDSIWWAVRISIIGALVVSSFGIYKMKKWGGLLAKTVMWVLLLWVVVTLTPDREQAVLQNVSVSNAYLIVRLILVAGYSLLMLWYLGKMYPKKCAK